MSILQKRLDLRVSAFALALILTGCEQANTYVAPPPPKVTIAQPLIKEVTEALEFTGTTVASAQVEVRARVPGVLQSMHFQPGINVNEGDLLFVIDPQEYEADLQAAEAELASAQADFERAATEYQRAQKLFKKKAGSEMEVVKWRGEQALARAAIQGANAKIERAKLNLGYTQIKAPLKGRIGRNRVDIGNLVGEGEATVLTDITHYDPMYAYFNLNELDLLRVMTIYRAQVKEKELDPTQDTDAKADIKVYLGLADEEGFPHAGVLDFAESALDPNTGTIQLRGSFDNAKFPPVLYPGLFARIRLPIAKRPDMPLVSERAIGSDQSGRYVLVVNQDNTVEKRNIKQGQIVDGMRVIEEGVRRDDWVVVGGIQRARTGMTVAPEKTNMDSFTTSTQLAGAEKTQAEVAAGSDKPVGKPSDDTESAPSGQAEKP